MIKEFSVKDISINKFKLHEECEKNPSLFGFFGEELAKARIFRDKATNNVKYTMAHAELFYRQNPPKDIKITEQSVSCLVEVDSEVIKAKGAEHEAKEKVYHLEAVMNALEARKYDLKNLTHLWIAGYYAIPGMTSEDENAMELRKNLNFKE